jgi:hypothetical protein
VIVIADTSPLNYLIRLGHSDILREIYGRVLVPCAVLIEMKHPEAPPEVRAWACQPPGKRSSDRIPNSLVHNFSYSHSQIGDEIHGAAIRFFVS